MNTMRKNGREEQEEERRETLFPLIDIGNSSGEEQFSQNSNFPNDQMANGPKEFGYGRNNGQKNGSRKNRGNSRSNNQKCHQNMSSKTPSVAASPIQSNSVCNSCANFNDANAMIEIPKPEPVENGSYETVNGLLEKAE